MNHKCPKCNSSMMTAELCEECGWRKPVAAEKVGPDHARIAADRERSIARAYEPLKPKIACQSTLCSPASRAIPGRDLCASCMKLEAAGEYVPRIRRPAWIKRAGELLKERAA